VCDGTDDAAAARSLVNRLTMRQNYWSVGAFCAAYCRILSVHHTIEDEHMFADLRRRDDALEPVLQRLSEEHEVIAEILDRLDRSLVALVADHTAAAREVALTAVDELAEVLLSHLAYEEEELVGPLSRLGLVV
jgi:hemerythrin-like domain-containing protein